MTKSSSYSMSTVEKFLAYNKRKKEGVHENVPPKKRKIKKETKMSDNVTFRTDEPKTDILPGIGPVTEQLGNRELYVPNGDDYDVYDHGESDDDERERDTAGAEKEGPVVSASKPLDLGNIGEAILTCSTETRSQLLKAICDATRGRTQFQWINLRRIYSVADDGLKVIIAHIAGLIAYIEAGKCRTAVAPRIPRSGPEEVIGRFDPIRLLQIDQEMVTINKGSTKEDVNVNSVLYKIPPMNGPVKLIVGKVAKTWISHIMSADERRFYSVSSKPTKWTTLPASVINPVLVVLAEVVTVEKLKKEDICNLLADLYLSHIAYLFDKARDDATRNAKREMEIEKRLRENFERAGVGEGARDEGDEEGAGDGGGDVEVVD